MAKNFGKTLHKMSPKKGHKTKALEKLEEWASKAHARWIPITQLKHSGYGLMTQRQARWIESQLKRKEIEVEMEQVEN